MADLYRGTLAHCLGNPFTDPNALELIEDGALLVEKGLILDHGSFATLKAVHPTAHVIDHQGSWLLPGFVDGHVHFPQHYATAAYGNNLLDWLNRSIFPSEALLADATRATAQANAFVARLLQAGTTTALVFGSQFEQANLALFEAAARTGLRLIAGMTIMDRGAPAVLLQSPEQAERQCRALIGAIQGRPRLAYAITPRFALSCSASMLERCGALAKEFGCYIQTHINENLDEIRYTRDSFPGAKNYLEVYDRFALLGPRTVLAHGIHSSPQELDRWQECGAAVCHCPSSNLYLGSGLMPLSRYLERQIPILMGSDIGAGTSFSIATQLAEAYKLNQLRRNGLRNPGEAACEESLELGVDRLLYLGTLAGAQALGIAKETGNFETGKHADFLILDPNEPYLRERLANCESLHDQLFVLLNQATSAQIRATLPAGTPA